MEPHALSLSDLALAIRFDGNIQRSKNPSVVVASPYWAMAVHYAKLAGSQAGLKPGQHGLIESAHRSPPSGQTMDRIPA